ncbi:MAG: DUF222 domain-containing protein, partial [Solirubrobacteraceae bacterium]|nr:DUF222 domain-containing protein [Solirubrobacteraceae bacterium]
MKHSAVSFLPAPPRAMSDRASTSLPSRPAPPAARARATAHDSRPHHAAVPSPAHETRATAPVARSARQLGDRYDELIRLIAADDAAIAATEARRARHLAEIAGLADALARLDGTAATEAGRAWARRRLAAEIGCATRRSERSVTHLVTESEHLVDHLPATLGSLADGSISYLHARAMIRHAVTLPEHARGAFEEQVLPHASALPPFRFDDRARRLREQLHPDSLEVRTRDAHDERHVIVTPECDGMATLIHHLTAADALAIDDLADQIARSGRTVPDAPRASAALFATDALGASEPPGAAGAVGAPDPRTHAQRRSDALRDLILGRGERPSFTPSVLVTVSADTLTGTSDTPGDLHGYGPIAPTTARTLAVAAPTYLRVVMDSRTGTPLGVTRHRTIPAPPPSMHPAPPP